MADLRLDKPLQRPVFKPKRAVFMCDGGTYVDEKINKTVAFYIRQCLKNMPENVWVPFADDPRRPIRIPAHPPPRSLLENKNSGFYGDSANLLFGVWDKEPVGTAELGKANEVVFQRDVTPRNQERYNKIKSTARVEGKVSQGAVYHQWRKRGGIFTIAAKQLFVDSYLAVIKGQDGHVEVHAQCRRIDFYELAHVGDVGASNDDVPDKVQQIYVALGNSRRPCRAVKVGLVAKMDEMLCIELKLPTAVNSNGVRLPRSEVLIFQGADQIPYGERTLTLILTEASFPMQRRRIFPGALSCRSKQNMALTCLH